MIEHERATQGREPALAPERLQEVVRAALGEPEARVDGWDAVALRGGSNAGAIGGGSALYTLTGTAHCGAEERSWSAVLKVLAPWPGRTTRRTPATGSGNRCSTGRASLTRCPTDSACPAATGATSWWAEVRPFLLDRAEEARRLLATTR